MIYKVLTVLKNHLNAPGGLYDPPVNEVAVVDDIAKHEGDSQSTDNKVVISLLSVEEESTLKNRSRYQQVVTNKKPVRYDKESAPAYINLYVMVSANRNMYSKSLADISKVIEVFQKNNVLEYVDNGEPKNNFTFRIELHSVPFDQLSYIWGLLGGKIMPSVLYKISVVKIVAPDEAVEVKLIDNVNIESINVD